MDRSCRGEKVGVAVERCEDAKISAENPAKNVIIISEHDPYLIKTNIRKRACIIIEPSLPTCQPAPSFPEPKSFKRLISCSLTPYRFNYISTNVP